MENNDHQVDSAAMEVLRVTNMLSSTKYRLNEIAKDELTTASAIVRRLVKKAIERYEKTGDIYS